MSIQRLQSDAVYSGCMIGNHGYEVILDGYVKGIVPNNLAALAYEAMKEEVSLILLYGTVKMCTLLHLGHQNKPFP